MPQEYQSLKLCLAMPHYSATSNFSSSLLRLSNKISEISRLSAMFVKSRPVRNLEKNKKTKLVVL